MTSSGPGIGMSELAAQTVPPLARVKSNGPVEHSVQLYSDDVFLIDVLSSFIGEALTSGDASIVIATNSHQRLLERKLIAQDLDPYKAIAQGRLITLDAAETLTQLMEDSFVDESVFTTMMTDLLARTQSTLDPGQGRVAIFGEMVALLWEQGKPQEAVRLEHLWNELRKKSSFSLLCAYPVGVFSNQKDVEHFFEVCAQHATVFPSEGYLKLTSEQERFRNVAQLEQKAQVLEKRLAERQGEQQFRLLVEAVQDYAIFMLDPTGHVASWNAGAERIKRYAASEIIGKHFSCFYPEEDIRNGKPQWELVTAAKEGRFEDEGWRIRKDGSRFWADVIITAVREGSGKLIGFAKVTRDFTERMNVQRALEKEVAERQEAERQLYRSEKSLRQLSRHLLRSQDEERKRIGRDLHDSLGQYLAVLKMKLESLASREQHNDTAAQDLARCVSLTQDCIREVRTVSYLLYPPMLEEMGLKSAIPWYLDGFSARSGISTTFHVEPGFGRLARDSELALFRVLQESLTNVHRHSGSLTAQVGLSVKDGNGVLEVEDQGKGVSPEVLEQAGPDWTGALGVGLRGMNERMRQLGGRLELVSTKNGTTIRAFVPEGSQTGPSAEDAVKS